MGEEIRITYETLFDLLRREKSREELQKLEASFLTDVETYLTEKHAIASGPNESFFSEEERQKTLLQLANVCRILRELYERREKKILNSAMVKSRAERALIDTSAMFDREKALFTRLVDVLSQQRREALDPLLAIGGISRQSVTHIASSAPEPKPEPLKTAGQPETLGIEFLAAVPKFVGRSLEIYGPYNPGQQALLPADIAQILIDKGRAKAATEQPEAGEEMDLGEPLETAPQ